MGNENKPVSKKTQGKKNGMDRGVAIACAVFALLIVAVLALNVLSECGVFARATSNVASENVKVDGQMMAFFLNDHIVNWYNQYSGYLSLFGVNFSYDLRQQKFGSGYESMFLGEFSGTWYDYFLSKTLEEVKMYVVYAEAAQALGIKLDDEDVENIDTIMENLKKSLKESGASFSDWYGKGVTEKDVRRCYELVHLASAFSEHYQSELKAALDKDDSALRKYVDDNKAEFYSADCLVYTANYSEQKFLSSELYDKAVAKEQAFAEKLQGAKTPEEFIEIIENKNKTTTSTETSAETETETATETAGAAAAAESASASESSKATEKETLSPEEELESKYDKYKQEINFSEGTGELEDWLFGSEWASEGEIKVIEVTGTEAATTSKATTAKTETEAKETETEAESKNPKAGESSSEESSSEEESTSTETKKTYKTYKISVYYVIDACDLDHEYTHNYAYLVTNDKAELEKFIDSFKALKDAEKTGEKFKELAEKQNEGIHSAEGHEHSADEMFEFNSVEKQTAGAFNTSYDKLNKWVEDEARKAGELSEIIEVTTGTGKDAKTTYCVIFFEKENKEEKGETWYVNGYASTVSFQFEEWYNQQLKDKPLDINTKALQDISTVAFATSGQ